VTDIAATCLARNDLDISMFATVAFSVLIAAALIAMTVWFFVNFARYHGDRVITCPETDAPVGVKIDAVTAARTALLKRPQYVVTGCTRWPEREGCNQACVPQIESSPDATLVRNLVADWYQGKRCVYCRKPIDEITGRIVPALRTTDGVLHDWDSIAPDELPSLLNAAAAVCANCELAEDFRLRFPDS
jgi:hypothetical protein